MWGGGASKLCIQVFWEVAVLLPCTVIETNSVDRAGKAERQSLLSVMFDIGYANIYLL